MVAIMKVIGLTLLIAVVTTACSTVTIEQQGEASTSRAPDYQKTQKYYFWGLVGERHINTSSICGDRPVTQVQSQQTFTNGFFNLITLGIYAPHTAKVWCGVERSERVEKS